jgi:uncharacterized protein (TIGR03790 family)
VLRKLIWIAFAAPALFAQAPANVLLVVNDSSPVSRSIGEYYARRRGVPLKNICRIRTTEQEEISRSVFDNEIAAPIAAYLKTNGLSESILYIVTTLGVPLKIAGSSGLDAEQSAVDSELTLLYQTMRGQPHALKGSIPNPFFRQRDLPFRHPQMPIYLVTRLAAYDFHDVRAMIDRSLEAVNRGVFVLDLKSSGYENGNDWLRAAAQSLPQGRVLLEETTQVVYGAKQVIGYASWGSNDKNRSGRWLHFEWLPGAIATEYVSTNARTFARPPDSWTISTWDEADKPKWWNGSPQSLTADLIHEGATGASGHVYEPYLSRTPRPEYVLPAYASGRNLAESFYLGIPALSWMNVVVGDPLCTLGKPHPR